MSLRKKKRKNLQIKKSLSQSLSKEREKAEFGALRDIPSRATIKYCDLNTLAALPGSAASQACFMAFISSCLSVSFLTSISSC